MESGHPVFSGIHLAKPSDETASLLPETETAMSCLRPSRVHASAGTAGLYGGLRSPSLPENLETPAGVDDIQRHISDPILPGS